MLTDSCFCFPGEVVYKSSGFKGWVFQEVSVYFVLNKGILNTLHLPVMIRVTLTDYQGCQEHYIKNFKRILRKKIKHHRGRNRSRHDKDSPSGFKYDYSWTRYFLDGVTEFDGYRFCSSWTNISTGSFNTWTYSQSICPLVSLLNLHDNSTRSKHNSKAQW